MMLCLFCFFREGEKVDDKEVSSLSAQVFWEDLCQFTISSLPSAQVFNKATLYGL